MKYTILIFLFLAFSSCSQNINGTEEERTELEKLIKEKIDSIRVKRKQSELTIDTALVNAARSHSQYMNRTGMFSHNESGKKEMKTPQDRVKFFGGTNLLVGENILWTDYNIKLTSNRGKKFDGRSLTDLANAIVTGWVESPDHYKNILTKEYTLTGIAVEFDLKKNRVYATQVFAYPSKK